MNGLTFFRSLGLSKNITLILGRKETETATGIKEKNFITKESFISRYVVLTSKHHEGYAMWPSSYGFGWNVQAVGPKRDLLGE